MKTKPFLFLLMLIAAAQSQAATHFIEYEGVLISTEGSGTIGSKYRGLLSHLYPLTQGDTDPSPFIGHYAFDPRDKFGRPLPGCCISMGLTLSDDIDIDGALYDRMQLYFFVDEVPDGEYVIFANKFSVEITLTLPAALNLIISDAFDPTFSWVADGQGFGTITRIDYNTSRNPTWTTRTQVWDLTGIKFTDVRTPTEVPVIGAMVSFPSALGLLAALRRRIRQR